jgi:hypothetical protein
VRRATGRASKPGRRSQPNSTGPQTVESKAHSTAKTSHPLRLRVLRQGTNRPHLEQHPLLARRNLVVTQGRHQRRHLHSVSDHGATGSHRPPHRDRDFSYSSKNRNTYALPCLSKRSLVELHRGLGCRKYRTKLRWQNGATKLARTVVRNCLRTNLQFPSRFLAFRLPIPSQRPFSALFSLLALKVRIVGRYRACVDPGGVAAKFARLRPA